MGGESEGMKKVEMKEEQIWSPAVLASLIQMI